VYVGTVSPRQLDAFVAAGVDRQDVVTAQSGGARLAVEAILTADQVKALDAEGVELAPKRIGGRSAARVLAQQSARDPEVFRSYSEPGGIRDELVRTTRRYPALTELVPLGPTVQGREILAVRSPVTPRRWTTAPGLRCSTPRRSTPGNGSPPRWCAG